ncbi:unnamed protein product, partial [Mesorhabditis belari]|uniref:Uncharacterized protein n=1 Tax=Mesorhabditis belari TaxID=2138241 RepID=A0AAF3J3R1_9BILA
MFALFWTRSNWAGSSRSAGTTLGTAYRWSFPISVRSHPPPQSTIPQLHDHLQLHKYRVTTIDYDVEIKAIFTEMERKWEMSDLPKVSDREFQDFFKTQCGIQFPSWWQFVHRPICVLALSIFTDGAKAGYQAGLRVCQRN